MTSLVCDINVPYLVKNIMYHSNEKHRQKIFDFTKPFF